VQVMAFKVGTAKAGHGSSAYQLMGLQ
jgi:hypothetical protein